MAFPQTPLDVMVELNLGGTWTDVTAYAYARDLIAITRGRADESSSLTPSQCSLTFNNRDGRFSPRNPTGPYFGLIGRNTPVRVSVAGMGTTRLIGTSPTAGIATTPDSAALSIVGDLDVRFDATLPTWSANTILLRKYTAPGQQSWRIYNNQFGHAMIEWSADGTTPLSAAATVPMPHSSGRQALRVTIDVDNGAGGRVITFYASTSMGGTWVQLGDPVVQSGVTSIFDSTALPTVVAANDWAVHAAEIRQGIAGTVVASPTFTGQTSGATSFVDAQGNTWTIGGTSSLTDRRYRFHGEVPSWPTSWDVSEKDVWVPVAAAGVTRRLGQGTSPLAGPIQRAVLRNDPAGTVGYWPMEDEDGATSIASGLPGGRPLAIEGAPELAADDTFKASGALPRMALAAFSGPVNGYTSTGVVNARCLMFVPAAGDVNGSIIMRLFTTGTAAIWDLRYDTAGAGGLTLMAYTNLGVNLLSSGAGFAVNGKQLVVIVELIQDGADVDWSVTTVGLTTDIGVSTSGTLAGRTAGAATYVQLNQNRTLDQTALGHLTVRSAGQSNIEDFLRGWLGETAGRRVERLCDEEDVTFAGFGDMDDTAAMGVQRPMRLLELLDECQATDMGILFETRGALGLAYRGRATLYNQNPAALAYSNLENLQPVDDDQATRNDITVSRPFGSSARAELTEGPLSTQAPPNGVGRYDDTPVANVSTDAALPDQASWRLHVGTVDEERYPGIDLDLSHSAFVASQALTASVLDLEVGDLVAISDPPAWMPPGTISQIVQGTTETFDQFGYAVGVNATPGSPWTVLVLDNAARLDSETTVTNEALDATETGVDYVGDTWITTATHPPEFPFDIAIGGEVMAVTSAVAGTFTVTRSVNGVVKSHISGAPIRLASSSFIAL